VDSVEDEECTYIFSAPKQDWKLPSAPAIGQFHVTAVALAQDESYGFEESQEGYYPLHVGWLPIIKEAMPALHDLNWDLVKPEDMPPSSVCQTLESGLDLSNLRYLLLEVQDPELEIYEALRGISTRLQELRLRGSYALSPHLFWPSDKRGRPMPETADDVKVPFWPYLKTLEFELETHSDPRLTHPSMKPLFDLKYVPHDIDADEFEDHDVSKTGYRLASAPVDFNNFLVAVSHAMLHMPKLEVFIIQDALCDNDAQDEIELRILEARQKARQLQEEATNPALRAKHLRERSRSTPYYFKRLKKKPDLEAKFGPCPTMPFYYERATTALGPDASDSVYGPMAEFGQAIGWEAPAEVLTNWAKLRRMLKTE